MIERVRCFTGDPREVQPFNLELTERLNRKQDVARVILREQFRVNDHLTRFDRIDSDLDEFAFRLKQSVWMLVPCHVTSMANGADVVNAPLMMKEASEDDERSRLERICEMNGDRAHVFCVRFPFHHFLDEELRDEVVSA